MRARPFIQCLALVLAACSGAAPAASPDHRGATTPAAAGASAASSAGTSAAAPPAAAASAPPGSTLITQQPKPAMPAPAIAGTGAMPATSAAPNSREPIAIDDCGATNPAGLSAADAQKLKAGGAPGMLQVQYPYDGTVFPRGMLAPDVLWAGVNADSVYVHIKGMAFEYSACLKPTAAGQLALPQDVWDKAGQRTYGKEEHFALELSTLSQGTVAGPITLHFQIAQATIKGSIFYNSYSSQLALAAATDPNNAPGGLPGGFPGLPGGGFPGGGVSNGVVLRIPASGRAEVFGVTDCNGCHSVSADGSRLLSQFVNMGTGAYGSQSYELAAAAMSSKATPAAAGPAGAFGALYPDGSVYLSTSSVIDVARASLTAAQGASPNATLYDAKTGQVVANQGIPTGALMPMFSPDGSLLVFNDYAIDQAHGIALMKYDVKTQTASAYKMLMKEPAGNLRPAWPFVLPDNKGVIILRTDGPDFSGNGAGVLAGAGFGGAAPFADLSVVDVASSKVTVLARAMGYLTPEDAASDKTYLPYGATELHHNYFPTVSPVAAGGYFWVFFDSVRAYGPFGVQRQLWGTAVDISADGTYVEDPSHPAFYLPGQEFGTGNHRAFAALDPCRKDSDSCTSGIDCCGGFCYVETHPENEFDEPKGTCSPKMMMCSRRDERCVSDADCCHPEGDKPPDTCIAGFCAYVPPPELK